ncbi:MAG TPA: DHHA1 domain-containing protein [Myxococcaceae bacterium]|nr:DHHA1 domain-containing protein [Myxococcaceae bacterium]
MRMKVLYHDSCFDGAASAAVFSRFYLEQVSPGAELSYEGLAHQAGGRPIDETVFTGEENAIVDFRYSQSDKLTWWFDHHRSAFQQPGDEQHFRSDRSGRKFHDPTRRSCTKYLAEIAAQRFGFDPKPLAELIEWAEIIDGAQFPNPTVAVELAEPALQLMTVLEANRDPGFIPRVIVDMQRHSLAELAARPYVGEPFKRLWEKHHQAIEVIRQKAKIDRGVVFFDVADDALDSVNKFIAYYLYPEARYTVWVGRGPHRAKVSIGSNPWKPQERRHDLSQIAERYGGGGHPVVAAISFPPGELERARKAAAEIASELRSSGAA